MCGVCVCVWCLCVFMFTMYMYRCWQKPEEGIGYPVSGITCGFYFPVWVLSTDPGSSKNSKRSSPPSHFSGLRITKDI